MSVRAIIFLLIAAAFGVGVWWFQTELERLEYLQAEGVTVSADVIGTSTKVSRSRDSTTTYHYARVRFTAPNSQVVTDDISIAETEYVRYASATEAAPHAIQIVTSHDGSDYFVADSLAVNIKVFEILRVAFAVTIAVLIALAIRAMVRRSRLSKPAEEGLARQESSRDKLNRRYR